MAFLRRCRDLGIVYCAVVAGARRSRRHPSASSSNLESIKSTVAADLALSPIRPSARLPPRPTPAHRPPRVRACRDLLCSFRSSIGQV